MAIKTWKSREDISGMLSNRNLIFERDEVLETLRNTNYYLVMNGIESIFLTPNEKPKNFNNKYYFKQFLFFYDMDRALSETIFQCLNAFEEHLKTSIAYNFCKTYCFTLNKTMEYTNKDNYVKPETRNNYPFSASGQQNEKLNDNFDTFSLFRNNYLHKLVKDNDNINARIYRDNNYRPPRHTKLYYWTDDQDVKHYDNKVAVPLWVSIQKITLGTLNMMCHYLDDQVLDKVMEDFKIDNPNGQKRRIFLNTIDLLLSLRNCCAHGELIYRFKTHSKCIIDDTLKEKMKLNCEHDGQTSSSIGLYDMIKILSMYEDVSSVGTLLKKKRYNFFKQNVVNLKLQRSYNKSNKISRKYSFELFDKYLKWIGKTSDGEFHIVKDWKSMTKSHNSFNTYF